MDSLEVLVNSLKQEYQKPLVAQTIGDRLAGMKTAKSLRFHDLMTTRSFEVGAQLLVDELSLELKVRVIAT